MIGVGVCHTQSIFPGYPTFSLPYPCQFRSCFSTVASVVPPPMPSCSRQLTVEQLSIFRVLKQTKLLSPHCQLSCTIGMYQLTIESFSLKSAKSVVRPSDHKYSVPCHKCLSRSFSDIFVLQPTSHCVPYNPSVYF